MSHIFDAITTNLLTHKTHKHTHSKQSSSAEQHLRVMCESRARARRRANGTDPSSFSAICFALACILWSALCGMDMRSRLLSWTSRSYVPVFRYNVSHKTSVMHITLHLHGIAMAQPCPFIAVPSYSHDTDMVTAACHERR